MNKSPELTSTLAQFFYKKGKINHEQFLEIVNCRLCRLEMGRRLSWWSYCVLYSILVTGLCELLILRQAQGDNGWDKICVDIFSHYYKLICDRGG